MPEFAAKATALAIADRLADRWSELLDRLGVHDGPVEEA